MSRFVERRKRKKKREDYLSTRNRDNRANQDEGGVSAGIITIRVQPDGLARFWGPHRGVEAWQFV